MPSAYTIRPATAADLAAVSQLLGETWHATYDGIYGKDRVTDLTGRWHSPDNLLRGLANKNGTFLVAVLAGSLAGTASAVANEAGTHLDLLRLYVRPDHQGGGLGQKLLAETLARFPALRQCALEVEPANVRAIAFYQRHGFVVAGKVNDCSGSGDGIPALKLVREIGTAHPA